MTHFLGDSFRLFLYGWQYILHLILLASGQIFNLLWLRILVSWLRLVVCWLRLVVR